MARDALARRPTIGWMKEGRDSYVTRNQLRLLVTQGASRYWTFHDAPTTVETPGNTYAKLWDRFTSHLTVAGMRELLREYGEKGVPRPGGYADIFHKRFISPRVPYTVNALLAPLLAGGWQEAISVGAHPGVFHKYDMRSAYLWAGSLGLPDVKTYRRSTHIHPDKAGIYAVELVRPAPHAPFPFNRARRCLATTQEIEIYGLEIAQVYSGIRYGELTDPAKMLEAVRAVSTWKEAGRSYWGRWGQRARVRCHAGDNSWNLPNVTQNIPWAHLIISRVRERLWNYSAGAVHVYVDSVITPAVLPVGLDIGDWKLEKTYGAGVIIKGPGQYGDIAGRTLDRMAGVPKNSSLRELRQMKIDILSEINADLLAE